MQLSKPIIEAAIDGFEGQKQHIDAQIAELRAMLNGRPVATEPQAGKPKRKDEPRHVTAHEGGPAAQMGEGQV